ncbi:MAG: VOC family protein [Stenotrophomonas sp.]|uniref:bleomycin resistance protein n=1 Tax=Stenotrophomonas sp. TaxID=69392 RepID=UPI0028AD3D6A|nr:VOC family protein [Stenotrophomonas sp.]
MTPVHFHSVSPFLASEDLPVSLAFYLDKLGFTLAWEWGQPAELAAVCRDEVELTLASRADAKPDGISRLYLHIDGIDDYHAQLLDAGVVITVAIADRPYGMRDFSVTDPAGNVLCFGQALPQPS